MLLIWVQKVPVKFCCQVGGATDGHQEGLQLKQLADYPRRANRVANWFDSLSRIFHSILASLKRPFTLPLFALLHTRAIPR